MKKTVALLVTLAFSLSLLAGCGGTAAPAASSAPPAPASVSQPTSAPTQNETPKGDTRSFTDSAGRTVDVPATITRISPSGGFAQMMLLALAPDLMVSLATDWSKTAADYLDPAYLALPTLGQFYGSEDLNLEEIAATNPQIIIDLGETKPTAAEDMDNVTAQTGIPAVHIEATTATTGQAFRTLGQLLGREEQGETLAAYCEGVYAEAQDIMAQVGDNKVSLLYCLGTAGNNVIAKDSFHAEILDMIANNVAVVQDPSSKGTGNEVDVEQILLWNPEVILFAPESFYAGASQDPTWQQLSAIQSGQFYEVPFGPYNWMGFPPSVNRYIGLLWSLKLLYPQYATYNMFERTKEYYSLFYHTTLTQQQYDALMANSLLKAGN